ncbi:hypothetical protein HYX12_02680, partial [Candidatus Woesearchaeota archaeon]|nr:hypothetical protein [Candidatus Woesearchaeota archaeon]
MNNIKHLIWLSTLIILLVISLASAQTGCFLYPESPFFCQQISLEQAQEECSVFNRCSVERVFKEAPCSSLPECFTILCKDTCQEEYAGRCASGIANSSWCAPGCCQFSYFDGEFCEPTAGKGICEVEAKNREAISYRFTDALQITECHEQCKK